MSLEVKSHLLYSQEEWQYATIFNCLDSSHIVIYGRCNLQDKTSQFNLHLTIVTPSMCSKPSSDQRQRLFEWPERQVLKIVYVHWIKRECFSSSYIILKVVWAAWKGIELTDWGLTRHRNYTRAAMGTKWINPCSQVITRQRPLEM